MRFVALGLVIMDALVMAALGRWAWNERDMGAQSVSHGTPALALAIGFFPWPLALFVGMALLLAAAFVYPWPKGPSDNGELAEDRPIPEPESVTPPSEWPPPPRRLRVARRRRTLHHWARPDPDEG